MLNLEFCENTVKAWKIVGTLIYIVKIAVPILIMITGIIPFITAITKGTSEELFAAAKKLFFKLLAGLIVFITPGLITNLIDMLTNKDSSVNINVCTSCVNDPFGSKCSNAEKSYQTNREQEIEEANTSIEGNLNTSELESIITENNNNNDNNNDINNDTSNNSNNNSNNTSTNEDNTNSNEDLKSKIENYINNNSAGGSWSVYVKNLSSGETVNINSNQRMISASIIKLFVMASAYEEISNNRITETSTLNSNISAMITYSSNESTNSVINSLPNKMNTVNNYNSNNGYSNTSLNRYLGGSRTPENYTSAQDVGNLLEKIYRGEISRSNDMLNLLKNQQVRHKIPAGISGNVVVANKTGELSDVENDSAIVYSGGDYIIVVLSNGVNNTSKAQETVKGVSSIVYNNYK